MRSALFVLVLALFASVALSASFYDCSEEQRTGLRTRHEWRKLEDADRRLFIEALLTLKNTTIPDPRNPSVMMSKYDMIVREHNDLAAFPHSTSLFFPWHRRYLLFFEDALRALGAKFQCVTLPYWDWTKDSSAERNSPLLQNSPTSFGGNGNRLGAGSKQWCLTEGPFAGWSSPNPASKGCLKRQFDSTVNFVAPVALWDIIKTPDFYLPPIGRTAQGFWMQFEGKPHANPHVFIGGSNGDMSVMWSPSDVLFWLHHTMVDLVWTIWMDCHDHDKVDIAQITPKIYTPLVQNAAWKPQVDASLDAKMPYGSLNPNGVTITPRMMHNINAWNYTYESQVDLISTADFGQATVCKFDRFKPAKTTRDVSSVTPSDNMERANSLWAELQNVKGVPKEGLFKMLVLAECQVQKSNADSYLPAYDYSKWMQMMGADPSASAFEPLC